MKYVYAYCDPRKEFNRTIMGVYFKFEPFYIGKGNRDRVYVHLSKSRHKRKLPKYSKIAKLQRLSLDIPIIICREIESDKYACSIETEFIKAIGRKDQRLGPLVNLGSWTV